MPTRALVSLAEAVAARDGRLVLVGDRAQLPPIDAGGAFASLADRLGAAELSENRRQRDPLQARVADAAGRRARPRGDSAARGPPRPSERSPLPRTPAPSLLGTGRGLRCLTRPRASSSPTTGPTSPPSTRPRASRWSAPAARPEPARGGRARVGRRRPARVPAQRLPARGRRPQRNPRHGRARRPRAPLPASARRRRSPDRAARRLPAARPPRLRGHRPRQPGGDRRPHLPARLARARLGRVGLRGRLAPPARPAGLRERRRARAGGPRPWPSAGNDARPSTWRRPAPSRPPSAPAPAPGPRSATPPSWRPSRRAADRKPIRRRRSSASARPLPRSSRRAGRTTLSGQRAARPPPGAARRSSNAAPSSAPSRIALVARLAEEPQLCAGRAPGPPGAAPTCRADLADFARQAEGLARARGALLDYLASAAPAMTPTAPWQRHRGAAALGPDRRPRRRAQARRAAERAQASRARAPVHPGSPPSGRAAEPERPRARWPRALRHLEGHRLRHGVADPERALGPELADRDRTRRAPPRPSRSFARRAPRSSGPALLTARFCDPGNSSIEHGCRVRPAGASARPR